MMRTTNGVGRQLCHRIARLGLSFSPSSFKDPAFEVLFFGDVPFKEPFEEPFEKPFFKDPSFRESGLCPSSRVARLGTSSLDSPPRDRSTAISLERVTFKTPRPSDHLLPPKRQLSPLGIRNGNSRGPQPHKHDIQRRARGRLLRECHHLHARNPRHGLDVENKVEVDVRVGELRSAPATPHYNGRALRGTR